MDSIAVVASVLASSHIQAQQQQRAEPASAPLGPPILHLYSGPGSMGAAVGKPAFGFADAPESEATRPGAEAALT